MNMPLTLPFPPTDPTLDEDVEGCEFVDGEWRPKHPDEDVEEEHDRRGCEYVDGEWREKNMSVTSDSVIGNLLAPLKLYVRANKLGRVQGPECGYQIFPAEPMRVRKPDVSFITAGKATPDQLNGNARVVPDFVAEMSSPNDKVDPFTSKVLEYLTVGVKLIWLVFPKSKMVFILRANGSGGWVAGSAVLSGEDVIPNFTITLDALFAED